MTPAMAEDKPVKVTTLVYLLRPGEVLLGMKRRGVGVGRWNGFGGKLEPGETVAEAARRELFEEAGVTADDLRQVGRLTFHVASTGDRFETHVFTTDHWTGEPRESEEMLPAWFALDALPYDQTWPDDRHWMPIMLAGRSFCGHFEFSDEDTITSVKLEETD